MRKLGISGLLAAALSFPLWGSIPAHPGMLNYVEGQADIDGKPVTNKSVGSTDVEQGQVIETAKGKAEILLTPGVFLRLGDNSALRMGNPGLANTSVELLKGEAMVEATDLRKANNIQVLDHGITSTVNKNGLYAFKFDQGLVAVYDGQLTIQNGDKRENLKKGKQIASADLKAQKFDTKQGNELYRWSDLRSEYLSEASVSSARTYLASPGGFYGGGWYWNQGFGYYSYLPGDGFLYSPFGWGFFAPAAYGYYGGGYYGGHYGGRFGGGYRAYAPVNRGVAARSFQSAPRAASFANASGAGARGGFSGGAHAGRR